MKCKKSLFQLDEDYTYLNGAFMSPMMKPVEEAGLQGLSRKRNPFTISQDDFFGDTEILREEFAKLINANDPKRIVVVPSVSYGMANVANNLSLAKDDEILLAEEQFPSNVYPWQRIAQNHDAKIITVNPPTVFENRGQIWNERILEAINPKTKMVAIAHVHWADGTKFDLKSIRERTRDVGALLVIDGTQSVGALPFDVQEFQPDALICAGYKWLMGPYSIGMAYYGPAMDDGFPIEENWINRNESEDFSNLVNYQNAYQPGALRYEVGEHSNFILIPMMLEALRQLNSWGIDEIQDYCKNITNEAVSELRNSGFMIEDKEYRGTHLFGIRMESGEALSHIKERLNEERILVSIRGNCVRVAPNVYNTKEDLHHLTISLQS